MRLVDADELIEHVWRDKLDSRELIAKMIDNAPTVKEISTKIPIDVFEKLVSQEPVLDKLRAEMKPYTDPKGFIVIGENRFNMILDRCKAESEVEDGNNN